jgi:hypothetical protein
MSLNIAVKLYAIDNFRFVHYEFACQPSYYFWPQVRGWSGLQWPDFSEKRSNCSKFGSIHVHTYHGYHVYDLLYIYAPLALTINNCILSTECAVVTYNSAVIPLNSTNQLIFVMETGYVFSEVRTGCLNIYKSSKLLLHASDAFIKITPIVRSLNYFLFFLIGVTDLSGQDCPNDASPHLYLVRSFFSCLHLLSLGPFPHHLATLLEIF